MNKVVNGVFSLVIGVALSASFVWLVGVGAASPVPEFLSGSEKIVVNYYSGIVTALLAVVISAVLLFVSRRFFSAPAGRQGALAVVPVALYLSYLAVEAPATLPSIMYAAVPVVLIIAAFLVVRAEA
ncbi:hypothetical protein [Microbulbifer rhizosphaerae]|uniref:Uncharacterized protein n=1 Tax=Microbulbifer rhizosphaerae TaxID=1562603 RepID=A0A7W4WAS4_9GAMM|nr:hypothetical protein [Microbulbifer rhizosphaerae]MBB3060609.1 hypothetical protein [Microbulbifer rhizosphaerae]